MILVTGGLGFIGSHVVVELLNAGHHKVVIIDNLSNSSIKVLDRIEDITGKLPEFFEGDILSESTVYEVFNDFRPKSVIHFAGLKSVADSVTDPLSYYETNVAATVDLLAAMKDFDTRNFIFSSSATVYGGIGMLNENSPLTPVSPYAKSKLMIETILSDMHASDPAFWNLGVLRYFNPVGAHPSGLIGENPNGKPNNLMPYMTDVALGVRDKLSIFGTDYNTPDGTAIRDYIHVVDLASAHIAIFDKMMENPGNYTYNIGTGKGTSVMEMCNAFRDNAVNIKCEFAGRRQGDIDEYYADCTKAKNELKWQPKYDISDMCRDAWNFTLKNNGELQ